MGREPRIVLTSEADLIAVGDAVRSLIGSTDEMSLSTMESNVNTAKTNIDDAFTALQAKGITVPSGGSVSDLASLIESIEMSGAEVATGTYTATQDIEITNVLPVTVPLGLNFTPRCLLFFQPDYDDKSAPTDRYEYVSCVLFRSTNGSTYGMVGVTAAKSSTYYYYGSSGFKGSSPSALATYNFKKASFKLPAYNNKAYAYLTAGKTFNWIAFGEA